MVDVEVEKNGDVAVVLLRDETLEATGVSEFKGTMEPILEESDKVVLDMSHIRFIDSMGCGVFISLLKRLQKKGGGLKICCITDPVESLFTLIGFDKLFGIFKTREDAVNAFK